MANTFHAGGQPHDPVRTIAARAIWGLIGGVVATGSKFIAQDLHWYGVFRATRDFDAIDGMIATYLLLGLILAVIGAAVAAASQGERHPMKLLGLGVAAPALITTWLGGQYPGDDARGFKTKSWVPELTSSAYAADGPKPIVSTPVGGFWRGAGIVVGIGKDQSRYFVSAGPFKNENEAAAFGMKLMKSHPNIQAFVGPPDKDKSVPLLIGSSLPYTEAKFAADKVKDLPELKDSQDVFLVPQSAAEGGLHR